MTRRLQRHKDFDVTLQLKTEDFIRPPRDSQRNWLLGQALGDFVRDLKALDELAKRFVPGGDFQGPKDRSNEELTDHEIMEDWQIPIMKAMAKLATEGGGHVLEVGFGRGVSSTFIQEGDVRAHTIVECNDAVVERYHEWKRGYPDRDIRLLHGKWQDLTSQFESYDAIFFHTYPLNEEEFVAQAVKSTTFAEHFFPTAAAHLRDGGVFTYLSNEMDSLGRGHQRLIFDHFSSFSCTKQKLSLPEDVGDAWWCDSMVIVKAVK